VVGIEKNSVPWGKTGDGDSHHLIHHCADVAACFEAIATGPVVRARLERGAGRALSGTDLSRLAVLAFLHDIGKVHPGFQAKGWPDGLWTRSLHGHVQEGAAIFLGTGLEAIARTLGLAEMIEWELDPSLLLAVLAHHGRPLPLELDPFAERDWETVPDASYDPVTVSVEIGAMIRRWFAPAFVKGGQPLPARADFGHLLCGFVSLADWLGSTRSLFPFKPELDVDYLDIARDRARGAVKAVGLDCRTIQAKARGRSDFASLTGIKDPRPQQRLVGAYPLDETLLILEAETGSGKTEAALWRFLQLFEAGRVDSLYFALPTRAAAIQLQGRVNRAMRRVFGAEAPEAVLAVPGYLIAGEAHGQALPGWEVRWDDDSGQDEQRLLARWAAESAKRYLAATIAVGTVDQVMLAALQVKHAHLRGAALSRALLVIDEVHASDSYQVAVQSSLLKIHLGRGGYAMLMSATLGSVARTKWLGHRAAPSFAEAVATPYPAVWGRGESAPRSVDAEAARGKSVAMALVPSWSAEQAAALALAAAREGAKVLVIRNTVTAAVATFEAIRASGGEKWLLSVAEGPALHHSRFAPEDRQLLDAAVEAALSPYPAARGAGGRIVIGTQTLEQSLDIDADLLITDLCPVDVLLQRIGRLHRHALPRPPGFEVARCLVLSPEAGLAPLLTPTFENGLGGMPKAGVLNGIYRDLSVVELTRRLVVAHPDWVIPAMNRFLVESATHPEPIEALHRELGPAWDRYRNDVYGKDIAEIGAAANVTLPVTQPFADLRFPDDEAKIRTRLGGEGARIVFAAPVVGPFGSAVSGVTLPPHWSHGIDPDERVVPVVGEGGLRFNAGPASLQYSRCGLTKRKP